MTGRIHLYTDALIHQHKRAQEFETENQGNCDAIVSEWDCGTFHDTIFISEEIIQSMRRK